MKRIPYDIAHTTHIMIMLYQLPNLSIIRPTNAGNIMFGIYAAIVM